MYIHFRVNINWKNPTLLSQSLIERCHVVWGKKERGDLWQIQKQLNLSINNVILVN